MKNKRKFLIFSPHPDDLDFACSGTCAKLISEGNEVVYCIITNGEKGGRKLNQSKKEMIAIREQEQRNAGKVVGVKKVIFLRQADGDLEHTRELRKKITEIIRKVKPNIVISFDPSNNSFDNFYRYHRDHRIAAEVVFDAIYPAVGSEVFFPELMKKNILPHKIDEVWFYAPERPNFFINITKTIDKKIKALKKHKSQIKNIIGLEKRIRDWAKENGKKRRMPYAETFRKVIL
ncbi:MAG: PIG-L family deacetylase [Patescibacteria group bacterium]